MFEGQTLRVSAKLDLLPAKPCPILVAALGPRMLRIAGELADGTITWMASRKTVATHIVPRISSVALAAGRPVPRICVGVPIAVTDDPEPVREKLAKDLRSYGRLPSYRRLLDIEGVEDPAQVVIVGNEADVERQLRDLAAVGATEPARHAVSSRRRQRHAEGTRPQTAQGSAGESLNVDTGTLS